MDFQLIVHGPYHFGDDEGFFGDDEPPGSPLDSPHTFTFDLPGVNGRHAILMFQTRNVNYDKNEFTLNGHQVPLRAGVESWSDKRSWSQQAIAVEGNWVHRTGNQLTVAAKDEPGGDVDVDDFAIADLIVMYHTVDGTDVLPTRPTLPRK